MFQNPSFITAFQKNKVKQIAKDFAPFNMNPLRVTVYSSAAGYTYNSVDVRNYFESINKPFDLIVR